MRNLKRALSLAMASVMLLGMMVVGTGAASYADVTSKDNQEAIEVLKEVGVMTGDEKGSFNPDKLVTRNEMAVVMANLLDLKVGDFAGSKNPFKDVPTWAQPYVTACYADNIIAGTSATTFGGDQNVTAVQAGLMILKALGYFQYTEDFGDDWQLATVKQASSIELYKNIDAGRTEALTRNEVAQLVLNALKADMVEFTGVLGTDIKTPDGTVIKVGFQSKYDAVVRSSEGNSNYAGSNTGADGYGTQQLCEKLYKSDLKKATISDDFGRPASRWTYKTTEIGKYADAADATYTAEVNSKTVYSDLGLNKTTVVDVMEDGKINGTFTIQKGATNKLGGNGQLIQAYADDDKNVTLVLINTYVGEITKVTEAKDGDEAYVNVGSLKFETEGFEKEDIVAYTKADNEIKSMYLADKIDGVKVSKVSGTSSFVADGTTYKYNKNTNVSADVKVDSVLDLYVDENGYVLKVDVSKSSSDYAYVLKAGKDAGRYDDDDVYYAQLLLADGTVIDAEVDEDSLAGANATAKENTLKAMATSVVDYSKDSKDLYTLKAVGSKAAGGNIEVEKGKASMTLNGATKYANSKTVFLIQSGTGSKATYTTYTGYANVPNLKSSTGSAAVYCKSGTVATMVFISGVAASSDDIVYVLASKAGTKVVDTDAGTYYEYKAVVNGEITTVKMRTEITGNSGKDMLYGSIAYDDKEYDILDTKACEVFSTTTTDDSYMLKDVTVKAEEKDDIIDLSGTNYAVSSKVEVYAVTTNDKIETGAIGDLEVNMTATAVVKDGEIVSIFYIKTGSSVTPPPVNDQLTNPTGVTVDTGALTITENILDTATTSNSNISNALKAAGYTVQAAPSAGKVKAYDNSGNVVEFTITTVKYWTIKVDSTTYYVENGDDTDLTNQDLKDAAATGATGYQKDGTYTAYATTLADPLISNVAAKAVIKNGYVKVLAATDYTSTVNNLVAASFALKDTTLTTKGVPVGTSIEYVLTYSGTANADSTITFTAGTNSTVVGAATVEVPNATVVGAGTTAPFTAKATGDVAAATVAIANKAP